MRLGVFPHLAAVVSIVVVCVAGDPARAENAVTASSFKDPIHGTEYRGSFFLMTVPGFRKPGARMSPGKPLFFD